MPNEWFSEAKVIKSWRTPAPMDGRDPSRKVIWHTSEGNTGRGTAAAIARYVIANGSEYHLTWDPTVGEFAQIFPASKAARSCLNGDFNNGIGANRSGKFALQICICGKAEDIDRLMRDPKGWDKLSDWIESWGVPPKLPGGSPIANAWGFSNGRRSVKKWLNKSGHFFHQSAPGNDHGDPGAMPIKALLARGKDRQKDPKPPAAGTEYRWQVAATTRFGNRRLVQRTKTGFSWNEKKGRAWMTAQEAEAAVKWTKIRLAKDAKIYAKSGYPFLILADGAEWPTNKDLLRRLNVVGKRIARPIKIISGFRSPYEAWFLRQKMFNGGNAAAKCCLAYEGRHTWEQCGKQPQSNHADGNAVDCGVINNKGTYISIGNYRRAVKYMKELGLGLPVGPPGTWQKEPWHVEISESWAGL